MVPESGTQEKLRIILVNSILKYRNENQHGCKKMDMTESKLEQLCYRVAGLKHRKTTLNLTGTGGVSISS